MRDVNFHDVEGQLVLHIFTHVVSILAVPIAHTKVPKVLDLSKVFDNEEVVLIGFRDTIGCLARPRQVSKLGDVIIHFSNRLLLWRLGCWCLLLML